MAPPTCLSKEREARKSVRAVKTFTSKGKQENARRSKGKQEKQGNGSKSKKQHNQSSRTKSRQQHIAMPSKDLEPAMSTLDHLSPKMLSHGLQGSLHSPRAKLSKAQQSPAKLSKQRKAKKAAKARTRSKKGIQT